MTNDRNDGRGEPKRTAERRTGRTRRTILRRGLAASVAPGTGVTGSAAAQETDGETERDDPSTARISFRNQPTDGSRVRIESVVLPDGGYVGIHYDQFFEDEIGSTIIGVSERLDPGRHEGVEFYLFSRIVGVYFESGELYDDQWLVAVPYRETNDNDHFEYVVTNGEEDGPYAASGAPVADLAYVTIREETTTS